MEEATDSSDSANPHASIQAEEEEAEAEREEQVPQVNQDSGAIAADSEQVPPSSAAASSTFTRTKKKKKYRTLSLSEFHHYNEPSSRPTDAPPPPPPTDPPHCSSGCESLKVNDGDSLFSRWPPWGPFMESENEEMRSHGCNSSSTAIRPIGYERSERAGLAESQESNLIPSLPGTNVNVVTPVIVQESAWKKGTGVVGNGGQSNSESKENALKEEEANKEETKDRN